MSRHGNISVFVPHRGCLHRCSFCNQFTITGDVAAPEPADIDSSVARAVSAPGYCPKQTELAFFGGSFTAIAPAYMERLLKAGYRYVQDGTVAGIRISTRPDCIDTAVLKTLRQYGVTAIELGCQSMRPVVLEKNNRGHTPEDVVRAAQLIHDAGFSLGLQMMTGLYGDDDAGAMYTAERITALQPDTVRIYPTLVLAGTRLHQLYSDGLYQPQTLEAAVELTAKLLLLFDAHNIRVIRTGLHAVEKEGFVAGPWHPAFGELCAGRVYLLRVLKQLHEKGCTDGAVRIGVPVGNLSKMLGQKKCNIAILSQMGYTCCVYEYTGDRLLAEPVQAIPKSGEAGNL